MADRTDQQALDRAMEESENLVLFYQPIHVATTGHIWGAEALLRQRRETGEIREAAIIHEAAENSDGDELFRLDRLVVRRAYTDAAAWQPEFPDVRLSVNLSPREFQEGNVYERLEALVSECGIDTHRVNLEITEVSHIRHPREVSDVLEALKRRGVQLWLDDFGVGFSSLSHLHYFPVDGIKLPGDFVGRLPGDERCRAIIRHLLALAGELGIAVIAEEVENEEQRSFLIDHGCDYIQGFLFSRPMELDDFKRLLRRSR